MDCKTCPVKTVRMNDGALYVCTAAVESAQCKNWIDAHTMRPDPRDAEIARLTAALAEAEAGRDAVVARVAEVEGERDEAQSRAERAVALLEQKPLKIKSLHFEAGVSPLSATIEHWAAREFAASFAESLGDAENYVAINLDGDVERDGKPEHVAMEVVIRRRDGKTPAQLKEAAIARATTAESTLATLRPLVEAASTFHEASDAADAADRRWHEASRSGTADDVKTAAQGVRETQAAIVAAVEAFKVAARALAAQPAKGE